MFYTMAYSNIETCESFGVILESADDVISKVKMVLDDKNLDWISVAKHEDIEREYYDSNKHYQ